MLKKILIKKFPSIKKKLKMDIENLLNEILLNIEKEETIEKINNFLEV
jgi:hypothetical protein